jgi:hypothetical protein
MLTNTNPDNIKIQLQKNFRVFNYVWYLVSIQTLSASRNKIIFIIYYRKSTASDFLGVNLVLEIKFHQVPVSVVRVFGSFLFSR